MTDWSTSNTPNSEDPETLYATNEGVYITVRACELEVGKTLGTTGRQGRELIHDPRAHLHQPMPVPKQLPQITILPIRYSDSRKVMFQHQSA